LQIRSEHFPSTVYEVINGAYAQSIKQYWGETLFSAFCLRQYNIVVENCYNIAKTYHNSKDSVRYILKTVLGKI
jgi:hypothetical protein